MPGDREGHTITAPPRTDRPAGARERNGVGEDLAIFSTPAKTANVPVDGTVTHNTARHAVEAKLQRMEAHEVEAVGEFMDQLGADPTIPQLLAAYHGLSSHVKTDLITLLCQRSGDLYRFTATETAETVDVHCCGGHRCE